MSALLGVYERDLVLVKGKGARVSDSEGRSYLDFAAGIGVNGLGYGDKKVAAAIKQQAAELIHVSNLYHSQAGIGAGRAARAAGVSRRACSSRTPAPEANEAAIKFARRVGKPQGRFELIAFEHSFHGRTLGALSLTWTAKYREPFEPLLPGAKFCALRPRRARSALTPQTAAVFLEPVQGEGGVRAVSPGSAGHARALHARSGALLVLDEVQCGLGRTGKLFAHQHAEITPDILTLAKPLGGGIPMGATLLREDLPARCRSATTAAPSAAIRSRQPRRWCARPAHLGRLPGGHREARRFLRARAQETAAALPAGQGGPRPGPDARRRAARSGRAAGQGAARAGRARDEGRRQGAAPAAAAGGQAGEIKEFLAALEACLQDGVGSDSGER
jgi:4-aminobutyrate aminotransferase-like enzyme